MKFYHLLFIIITLSNLNSSTKDINTIIINYDKTCNYPLSNFITNCNIVKLETSDSILTGDISDIEFHENNIIILDKKNNTAQVFNQKGEFIHQLSNLGRGPGEYLYLNDIATNSQGIYLLDYTQQKILHYDYDWKFQKDLYFPFYVSEINCIHDKIMLYTERNGEKEDYQFYLADNCGKILNRYLPRNNNWGNNTFIPSNVFTQNNNSFIFAPRFNNTLYTLHDTIATPIYTLNFRDKTFPEERTNITKYDINDNKFPYIVRRNIFLCNNYLLIDYVYQDKRNFYLYDMNSHKSQNGYITNDLITDFRFFPQIVKDNKIIDWIDAASLIEYFPHVVQENPILHDLKETDNPILFIYNSK